MVQTHPSDRRRGVARGHVLPTNATTIAFFLEEALETADLCNDATKLPKRTLLVARECHAPSQGGASGT